MKVKPHDTVKVTATPLARHLEAGKTYKMHKLQAEKLKKRGLVE